MICEKDTSVNFSTRIAENVINKNVLKKIQETRRRTKDWQLWWRFEGPGDCCAVACGVAVSASNYWDKHKRKMAIRGIN